MTKSLILFALATLLAACNTQPPDPTPAAPLQPTLITSGLTNPTGVNAASEGELFVIEQGMGGDTELPMTPAEDGSPRVAQLGETSRILSVSPTTGAITERAKLPSISSGAELAGGNRLMRSGGALYASIGAWNEDVQAERPALVGSIARIEDGEATPIATTWDFEVENNPDGVQLETNPFGLAEAPDGSFWITDAAANSLLRLEPESGEISLIATFGTLEGGAEAVPTGLAFDSDGSALVTLFTGFSFPQGGSKVVKVTPEGYVSDYATGLSTLVDVRLGPDGRVYAVQFGAFGENEFLPDSGAIFRLGGGDAEKIVDGLNAPSALSFDSEGNGYVTLLGNGPASGSLVRFDGLTTLPALAD